MASEWVRAPLGTLVAEVFDRRGVTPEKLGSSFQTGGHRVVSAKHIKGSRIDLDAGDDRFVDGPTYARWMKSSLLPGDVIVTSEAPLGEVAFIDQPRDWCLGQRLFGLRPGPRIDGHFLFFALRSSDVQADIQGRATGTTVHGIRQPELLRVLVPVPPLREQRTVAAILGALDDKIELNRQMNRTLEAMARALFKSWFVDFDPVRAKMAGRAPFGMDAATAALFPARLRDTPLSPLPSDWDVTTLGDICAKPQYGLTASAHWGAHGPRFLRITDINKDAWIHWAEVPRCAVDPEVAARYALRRGDILIARMADPGHVAVVDDLEEPAVFASYLIRFRPRDEATGKYIQYVGRSTSYWDYLAGIASGSAQQNVNAPALAAFRLALPPAPVLDAFSNQVSRLRGCGHAALRESRTLAELRDLLLPKLLSGELRIRDAEKAVEAVI